MILVGDTAAMIVLGHDSTVPVTMDEMLFLTRAVARGARRPLVVADMPFGSYQVSDEDAVRNAIRFVKEAGADAVKLEGAGPMLSRVRAIVGGGDPGDGPHRPDAAVGDRARRLQGAGPHAPTRRAARSTTRGRSRRPAASRSCSRRCPRRSRRDHASGSTIPTIGIGAGAGCDGQVLVWHDLLGLYDGQHAAVRQAVRGPRDRDPRRARGVRRATSASAGFPEEEHTYAMADEELAAFEADASSATTRTTQA